MNRERSEVQHGCWTSPVINLATNPAKESLDACGIRFRHAPSI